MPGTLKIVRVLMIIRIVLGALGYALALIGLASMSPGEITALQAEIDMPVGVGVALELVGITALVFET
jgi:hypothetical protein